MKILINDGYENAKQLLYDEGLEDKGEELNNEILAEDYVIKELYDEDYAFIFGSDSDVSFFVKKKDGNKETFTAF